MSGWFKWCCLVGLAACLGAGRVTAQGAESDYQRALSLRERTAGKVFKDRVRPHWFADGLGLWYRNDLSEGRREFIRVDAVAGRRERAFDHQALARALGRALGRRLEADRLPIDRLELDWADPVVRLRAQGAWWSWDPAQQVLTRLPRPAGGDESLPVRRGARPSRSGGEETHITFINRTAEKVQLFWIDTEGQRRSYGLLEAGGVREQHTYAGHVWLVTDAEGEQTLAVFVATEEEADAVIDGSVNEGSANRPAPVAESDAARPPARRWEADVRNHNVWLRDTRTGEERALTTDGSPEEPYAGGPLWSPGGRHFVLRRVREAPRRRIYLIESSPKDQLQPKLHELEYPKPGDPLPVPRVALFDAAEGRQIPVSDALFTNAWSLTDWHWSPDGRELFFLYNRRGHQLLRVLAVEAATGSVRPVVKETSRTFIDYAGKKYLRYLDRSGEILWMSERDGWNHLYLYDAATGRVKHQVTQGAWVVREVLRVDEQARQVWFLAGGIRPGQDPYFRHLCRVNFDGSGLVVLTEGNGDHQVAFSPDRRLFLDRWSRVDRPPVTELRRAEDGALVCRLEEADVSALYATGWRPPEPFVAKGRDGRTDIYGVIYRPSNFHPDRRYPVIEEIYAGPQSAYVPKSFGIRVRPQAIAELGFIVVQIDGMGTSHRSKAFHDVCWKNLGDAGFPDRIA